ncbi:MAG TPA: DNA adenine methylase [Bacillota bacterium]|nr:DNA adenine methylase [Bacillota bacterium]
MSLDKQLVRPFVKWAGGKRQLLHYINEYRPKTFNRYIEPFVGGGSVFLDFQLDKPVINDFNEELINTYKMVRDKLADLIEHLKVHEENNSKEYYYEVRSWDREDSYQSRTDVERAARFIYLNKTGYNGLYRVNSKNQFNVPFGRYENPNIVNEDVLQNVSAYLNQSEAKILCGDFEKAVEYAEPGDFIYFDPPYAPIDADSQNFVGYTLDGFGYDEQVRLKETFDRLHELGCYVMLSNSSSEFIHDLYKEYADTTQIVGATRNVNSKASGRGKVDEVIVMNY